MINKYRPHVVVLPEDEANEKIANGFLLASKLNERNIQVLRVAGGWTAVRDSFVSGHNDAMRRTPLRQMVLLVDFDDARFGETKVEDRITAVLEYVDPAIRDRVFVLGARSEPEKLKAPLGSYEKIGKLLAKDCVEGTHATWDHPLLAHNRVELDRMMESIKPILFG